MRGLNSQVREGQASWYVLSAGPHVSNARVALVYRYLSLSGGVPPPPSDTMRPSTGKRQRSEAPPQEKCTPIRSEQQPPVLPLAPRVLTSSVQSPPSAIAAAVHTLDLVLPLMAKKEASAVTNARKKHRPPTTFTALPWQPHPLTVQTKATCHFIC